MGPEGVEDSREQAEREEDDEEHEDLGVDEPVEGRALEGRRVRVVLHELRVVARVDDHAEDPAGVAQHRSAQQQLVRAQGHAPANSRFFHWFFLPFVLHSSEMGNSRLVGLAEDAVELVEVPVGRLALDVGPEAHELARVEEVGRLRVGLPDLQVRLAVKVGRLDERHGLRLRGRQEDQVRREEGVVVHLHSFPSHSSLLSLSVALN